MDIIPMDKRIGLRKWFRDNRLPLFYATMGGSSFISLITIQGFFNLFFYALLAMVIVRMNEEKYHNLPLPEWDEIFFGVLICSGSFIFDIVTRGTFGGGYGQTDYTILVIGILFLFFGYRNMRVLYLPVLLVGGLSVSLKALQLVYDNFFDTVANWFVEVISSIAGPEGLGYPVYNGAVPAWANHEFGYPLSSDSNFHPEDLVFHPGTFTVFGVKETASLHVAWGCTGLRSLVMFSFILAALIWPMDIALTHKSLGLAIGIFGAFLINILRLVMLALIMYYRDIGTTMQVHTHLGDFLFILWMAVYWWLFFRYFSPDDDVARGSIS